MNQQKQILVVDDVSTSLKCIKEILWDIYQVDCVSSGKEALAYLQNKTPDMILLDDDMPDMNGYDTFKAIHQNSQWYDLPIIFLTSDASMEKEEMGLKMGAMEYLHKPFVFANVRRCIDHIFKIKELCDRLGIPFIKDDIKAFHSEYELEEAVKKRRLSGEGGSLLLIKHIAFTAEDETDIIPEGVMMEYVREIAGILTELVRAEDVRCRLDKNLYAIFFPGYDAKIIISRIIDRFNNAMEKFTDIDNRDKFMQHISSGIVFMPKDGGDLSLLRKKAEDMMEREQRKGRYGLTAVVEKLEQYMSEKKSSPRTRVMIDRGSAWSVDDVSTLPEMQEALEQRRVDPKVYDKICRHMKNLEIYRDDNILIVFIIEDKKNAKLIVNDELHFCMNRLEIAIDDSLRKRDFALQYNENQMVVILNNITEDNGKIVASRIIENWNSMTSDKVKDYKIAYELRKINEMIKKEEN